MNKKNNTSKLYKLPWGPSAAVFGTIGIFLLAQIAGAILVFLYGFSRGWSEEQVISWVDEAVTGQFVYMVLVQAITLLILFLFLNKRKAHPRDIGLKAPKFRDFYYTIAGFAAYFLLFILVMQIVSVLVPGIDLEQPQELGFDRDLTGNALVYVFVALVILPPIVEEILSRGFLYSGLRTKMKMIPAALITSVIFGAAHLQFGADTPLLWVAAIDTFVLSLVLVYLREKTGSLLSPIGLHMIKNGIAFTALFVLNIA